MMVSGPLSNRIGRKKVLTYAAILYAISAIGSALAPDFVSLVIFRMIGGFGVGACSSLHLCTLQRSVRPKCVAAWSHSTSSIS